MVDINNIIDWVKSENVTTTLIIIGGCLFTLFIIFKFVKRYSREYRQLPDLNTIEKNIFFDGVNHRTKIFETGGKEFDTKPEAYAYAKSISKKIQN